MNTFRQDLDRFINMARAEEPFAIGRYGDGEYACLMGRSISNGEFDFSPAVDGAFQRELIASLQWRHPGFYIGTACPCCQPASTIKEVFELSGQPKSQITWSNVFVNSNFKPFQEFLLEIFSTRDVWVVSGGRPVYVGPAKGASWTTLPDRKSSHRSQTNREVVKIMAQQLSKTRKQKIVLVSAGPFSEVIVHQLFSAAPHHVVLDVGSTLDPLFFGRKSRSYHNPNSANSTKTCLHPLTGIGEN